MYISRNLFVTCIQVFNLYLLNELVKTSKYNILYKLYIIYYIFIIFHLKVVTVKLGTANEGIASSPESSSDSSPPPTPNVADGPRLEAEQLLPGIVRYLWHFIFYLCRHDDNIEYLLHSKNVAEFTFNSHFLFFIFHWILGLIRYLLW